MGRSYMVRYMLRILFGLGIVWNVASQPGLSQHPGGAAGAGGAGTGRTTTTPRNTNTTPNMESLGRGTYLSGKVMMDDGAAPPESVLLERVCNGKPRPEGYTDSKGRFSFQLGQNQALTEDASYDDTVQTSLPANTPARRNSPGMGQNSTATANRVSAGRNLEGCELRAALPGFRSDVVNLSGRRLFDNPEVGTLILHRLANVEGTTISMTTLQAPKDARKAYEKAREALRKEKIADAQKDFEKAVSLYPQFAAAWYELGMIREKSNDLAEARKYYSQALVADSKLVTPYLRLAELDARDKKWQEVADATSRVIKLNPVDFADAYFYNAVANYHLHKLDAAAASARETQKLDPAHRIPKVDRLLGAILFTKKDYAGAAEQLRNFLMLDPSAAEAAEVKAQLAELEKLMGATKAKAEEPEP
jgi:tetratricopeptide (TPR) repeat protein